MLTDHLADYFLCRPLAATTQKHYQSTVAMFDGWNVAGADCNETLLNQFLLWYESQVSSPNTVRSKRAILLAVFRFAGLDVNSRRVRLVRKRPKLIDSWTIQECQTLIYAASRLPGTLSKLGTNRGDYAACLLAVALESGLRRGDLARVTCSQIRKGKWQQIQNKTGNVVECQISSLTRSKVSALPCFGGEFAFPAWVNDHKAAMSAMARRAMIGAWLESKDGCLKKLRRSSITIAEKQQAGTGYLQAGHTTPVVTRESYLDVSQIDRKRPEAG